MRFREATSRDRDAILALRRRCFGDDDPDKLDPRFWDWEFSSARVFVGEHEGTIVTHIAIVPWGDAALAVDAMTAPEARGSGAYGGVMAHAVEAAGNDFPHLHAFQIRRAVLGPTLKAGWSVAESIPVLVRPAFLPVAKADCETLDRGAAREMATLARSREFIEWRFFDNPRWSYRVTGVRDREGRLGAWLVTRRTTLKGVDTLAIVDLAFREDRAARTLIAGAVRDAKGQGCTLVAAFVSKDHPARRLFRRSFFIAGPHRFRLLVMAGREKRRQITWADTDHL